MSDNPTMRYANDDDRSRLGELFTPSTTTVSMDLEEVKLLRTTIGTVFGAQHPDSPIAYLDHKLARAQKRLEGRAQPDDIRL